MATNIVKQIFDQIDSKVSTLTSHSRLKRIYDLDEGDIRSKKQGYGVRHLASAQIEGVTRVYTMDQRFEVILTDTALATKANDSSIQTKINTLYNKIDLVFQDIAISKIGLPAIVLQVRDLAIEEPELLEGNDVIVMRFSFGVNYRQSIV